MPGFFTAETLQCTAAFVLMNFLYCRDTGRKEESPCNGGAFCAGVQGEVS